MEFLNLENTLNQLGQQLVDTYKGKLADEGINASNALSNSVKYQIERNGTVYEISLNLQDYWKYVEKGRRAGGKFPPIDKIEQWIRVKPVIPRPYNGKVPTPKQLAYLISRKIAREGIEPKPVLRRSINESWEDMMDDIVEAFAKDISINVDEVLTLFKNI